MSLDELAMALLSRCAETMARDAELIIDLSSIRRVLIAEQPAAAAYLAERVQELTNYTRTVRQTTYAMLRNVPSGISSMYVVTCDFMSAPNSPVTSFTADMIPYVISPGRGLGCTKAQIAR